MKAIVVLTPTESKKLIATALHRLPEVQSALQNGMVAIHPSSSTYFLYEAITSSRPEGLWVCGVVSHQGLCGSMEAVKMIRSRGAGPHDPRDVSKETWVFDHGVLQPQMPLGEILDKMTQSDVYIKGVNALDPNGKVGVLFSNPAGGGGTIGKVMAAKRKKNFHVLYPVGNEKRIGVPIQQAAHAIGFQKADLCMGIPAALLPVSGKKIDETDAYRILYGVEATPLAAGGLAQAGGCLTMVLDGPKDSVAEAFAFSCQIKGTKLPQLALPEEKGEFYPMLRL